MELDFKKYIAIREDWPKPHISFKDINPLLANKDAFDLATDEMLKPYKSIKIDKIICADARGFIFGAAIAAKLKVGLVMARKPNKMPYVGTSISYTLEYGSNTLEIAPNTILEGENVLMVDDLLATGGSANALQEIVIKNKAKLVGATFLIELTSLKGRDRLHTDVFSLIKYEI